MSQAPGQLIASKYRLIRPLGSGGMGTVWAASHVELEVDVALKFLLKEGAFDQGAEQRFRREARAAAQLKSPHVVHIHDYGVDQGSPYIAMELLVGEDLASALERLGPLPLAVATDWIEQAGRGLLVVHRAGIVHRDIKPSNLFASGAEDARRIQILDFGLAKRAGADASAQAQDDETTAGLVLGSPAYMSPEQARGQAVDQRSDLWSLGAVFYRMLTGVSPFTSHSSADLLVRLCTEDAAPPSRVAPWTSDWLENDAERIDQFFTRALHRDPNRRFPTLEAFLEEAGALTRPLLPTQATAPPSGGRAEITEALPRVGAASASPVAASTTPRSSTSRRNLTRPIALVLALLLICYVFWVAHEEKAERAREAERARTQLSKLLATARPEPPSSAASAAANAPPAKATEPRVPPLGTAPGPGTGARPATSSAAAKASTKHSDKKASPAPSAPAAASADPVFGLPVQSQP